MMFLKKTTFHEIKHHKQRGFQPLFYTIHPFHPNSVLESYDLRLAEWFLDKNRWFSPRKIGKFMGSIKKSPIHEKGNHCPNLHLGGGFKYFFFHPYLGKISNFTNSFQMGWNHQPVILVFQPLIFRGVLNIIPNREPRNTPLGMIFWSF